MSDSEKTFESEQLFKNVHEKSEPVELDDINENNDGDINGKKQALENMSIMDMFLDDEIEKLKQYRVSCRDDESFLLEVLPKALNSFTWNSMVNCFEYILQVYDEFPEYSEGLKEKINKTMVGIVSKADEDSTYLYTISENYSAGQLMRILVKHLELVQPVLNLKGDKGKTPLLNAVQNNNAEVAKYLIQCCADVTIKDDKGETAIHLAAIEGFADLVTEILKICPSQGIPKKTILKNSDLYGEDHSIFFPALQSGNILLYKLLMKEEHAEEILRAEMGSKDFYKVLYYLCEEGLNEILEELVLLDKTILSQRGEDGTTPLIWAVKKNKLDMAKFILLECGREDLIDVEDKSGRGVIYYALPHFRILEYLLSNFPKSEVQTKFVCRKDENSTITALEVASIKGYRESAVTLVRHGAYELFSEKQIGGDYNFFENVQSMDLETLRAILNLLEEYVSDFWFRCLTTENSDFYPPLLAAAQHGRDDLVNLLLDKGADAMQRRSRGKLTALHCAVESGSLSTVDCLVQQEPRLCAIKTPDGKTALQLAVEQNKPLIAKFLLASQVTYDETERLLSTAIFVAKGMRQDLISVVISCLQKDVIKREIESIPSIMHILVRIYPKAAVKLLDKCFEKKIAVGYCKFSRDNNAEKTNYDFYFLKHMQGSLSIIDTMINLKRDECLSHPVVQKFVELKLNSPVVKRWFYCNLLLYVISLICFTTHIVLLTKDPSSAASVGLKALSVIPLIINTLNMIKELFQMWFNLDFYFYDFSNYVEWTVHIASFVYFVPLSGKNERQIEAGAIAVFLAWVNLIWYLKGFFSLGIYIVMLKKIFISLFKVLPIMVLFTIAFGVVFLVLMSEDNGFNNFPISFLTTTIMVTGEIDYRDVFLTAEKSPYRFLQRLFLVLIVMVGGIVLMNFLVGLAVDDTSKILERSEAEIRMHRAYVVSALDRSLHTFSFLSSPSSFPDDYEEIQEYKFSERVLDVRENDDRVEEDKGDPVLIRLNVLEKSLDNLRRLMEKQATAK